MVSFAHDAAGTAASVWAAEIEGRRPRHADLGGDRTRVLVVAAHPDDETLGAGGLVAYLHALGRRVDVVVATRGERSHPRSTTHPASRLADVREAELRNAVEALAPHAALDVLGLPDGALAEHEDALLEALVRTIGDGRDALVVAPWREDGHPDHEAAGRAAATAAHRCGARLLEYPVWFWHWGTPADAPWHAAVRVDLDEPARAAKRAAIDHHRSQVRALSDRPGDEVLLTPQVLEHFATTYEVMWEVATHDEALDRLHADVVDPWGVEHRFYERRKRDLVLAALPRKRFARALEIGCSTGALAADLAPRVDRLVAVDSSEHAVRRARERLAQQSHVEVVEGDVLETWPAETLDLVVLSEVAYFLSPRALDALADRLAASLRPEGVVVLCHWRHPVKGWPLDGPAAHERLCRRMLPPVVATYRDRDVELLVLARPDLLPDPHEG